MQPLKALRRPHAEASARLVLLHGLGSNEYDLMELASYLSSPLEVVTLQAPLAYGPGFSWFDIDFSVSPPVPDADQARESALMIAALLQSFEDGLPLVVGGFSQGAMITLGLLGLAPAGFAGAVLLSGAPMLLAPLDDLGGMPVFVSHGLEDDVLPCDGADVIEVLLESAGAAVEGHRYPMGHGVSLETIEDLDRWLQKLLGDGG